MTTLFVPETGIVATRKGSGALAPVGRVSVKAGIVTAVSFAAGALGEFATRTAAASAIAATTP